MYALNIKGNQAIEVFEKTIFKTGENFNGRILEESISGYEGKRKSAA